MTKGRSKRASGARNSNSDFSNMALGPGEQSADAQEYSKNFHLDSFALQQSATIKKQAINIGHKIEPKLQRRAQHSVSALDNQAYNPERQRNLILVN